MTDTPIRAVIYARVSKARTTRLPEPEASPEVASDSIESQVQAMTRLAEREGYVLIGEPYVDDGISGFKGVDRPAFSRLLQDLGKGLFDMVLVRHEDRLSRNPEDSAEWMGGCARHGIRWQTEGGMITDPKSAGGGLLAQVTAAIGHYESKVKRERLLLAYERLRDRGELLPSSRTFGWGDDRRSEDPAEANLVRFIFESVAEGGTVGAMVRYLNDHQVPQVGHGARWQHATVTAILTNARYFGAVLERDGTIREGVEGRWDHLVSRETFEAAQAQMKHRRDTSARRPGWHYSTRHLLGGIIRCGVCGGPMRSSSFTHRKGGPSHAGYRCETNRGFTTATEENPQTRKDGLRHASLRVDEVDEAARQAVVDAFIFGTDDMIPADTSRAEARRVMSALAGLDEEVAGIWALQDEGVLTFGQANDRARQLAARRSPLESELKVLRDNSAAANMVVDLRAGMLGQDRVRFEDVIALKVQLRKRFDALDIEPRRALVESLLEVTATGGRRSARNPQRFRITHRRVLSLNDLEVSAD